MRLGAAQRRRSWVWRGVILVALLTMLGLWLLNVPLAFTLGLIAGLFNFVSYIGPIASAVPAGLLVYPQYVHLEHVEPRHTRQIKTGTGGYFGKVGRWLREGF